MCVCWNAFLSFSDFFLSLRLTIITTFTLPSTPSFSSSLNVQHRCLLMKEIKLASRWKQTQQQVSLLEKKVSIYFFYSFRRSFLFCAMKNALLSPPPFLLAVCPWSRKTITLFYEIYTQTLYNSETLDSNL